MLDVFSRGAVVFEDVMEEPCRAPFGCHRATLGEHPEGLGVAADAGTAMAEGREGLGEAEGFRAGSVGFHSVSALQQRDRMRQSGPPRHIGEPGGGRGRGGEDETDEPPPVSVWGQSRSL